jgi:hypothetical protein
MVAFGYIFVVNDKFVDEVQGDCSLEDEVILACFDELDAKLNKMCID